MRLCYGGRAVEKTIQNKENSENTLSTTVCILGIYRENHALVVTSLSIRRGTKHISLRLVSLLDQKMCVSVNIHNIIFKINGTYFLRN